MADFIIEIVVEVIVRGIIYVGFDAISSVLSRRLGLSGRFSGCLALIIFLALVGLCIGGVLAALPPSPTATPIPR